LGTQLDIYETIAGYMFFIKARSLIKKHKYNTIITSSSPFYCHATASKLRQKFEFNWIADYRDLWSANHVKGSQNRKLLEYERKVIAHADACITVSKGLRNDLRKVYGGPIHVIYNGYQSLSKTKEIIYGKKCAVEYTGQIYMEFQNVEAPIRFFENSLNAKELEVALTFAGASSHFVSDYFKSRNRKLPDFVKTIGHLSHSEAITRQQNANFLLFLNWSAKDDSGVIPSKIFEYISSGIPIIVSGSTNESELKQIISKSGYQLHMNSQQDLENILLGYKHGNLDIPPRNVEFISYFEYSQQVNSLVSIIDDPSIEITSVDLR